MEAFQRAKGDEDGAVFLPEHDAFSVSITPDHLTRITLPSAHMVVDLSRPNSWDGSGGYDLAAAATAYFSGLASDAMDLFEYFLNAQATRGEIIEPP